MTAPLQAALFFPRLREVCPPASRIPQLLCAFRLAFALTCLRAIRRERCRVSQSSTPQGQATRSMIESVCAYCKGLDTVIENSIMASPKRDGDLHRQRNIDIYLRGQRHTTNASTG